MPISPTYLVCYDIAEPNRQDFHWHDAERFTHLNEENTINQATHNHSKTSFDDFTISNQAHLHQLASENLQDACGQSHIQDNLTNMPNFHHGCTHHAHACYELSIIKRTVTQSYKAQVGFLELWQQWWLMLAVFL